MNKIKIFPSLIGADLLNLEKIIHNLDDHCDGYHLDVMDDHFVPNLTFGPMFINAIAGITKKPLFVHLMVEDPKRWIDRLALTSKDSFAFHFENKVDHKNLIKQIREKKWRAAIGINPKTPLEKIFSLASEIDQVLLMSVEPGFSGQAFLKSSTQRIDSLVKYREQQKLNFEIVIDGGVDKNNILEISKSGANQLAIDSAIFAQGDPVENLAALNKIITK